MNLRQLLVCCGLVLASLQLPAEPAPTHSRLASTTSADANLLAALDSRISSSVNGSVAEGWMLRGISSLSCDACEAAVGVVQDLFEQGKDWDYLATIAGDICIALKIEDRNVCMSITQLFKDEIFTVFSKVALSPKEVCGILLGPPCGDSYDPWDQEWNITVPGNKPPVVPVPPPKPNSPVIRILQLSDIHVDLAYTPGLTNDCGEPLCCRVPNPPGHGSTAAGYWGDYNCDVPLHTLENLMEFLGNRSDQFDLVYWTGDLPAHNVWNQSREDQLTVQKKVVELMLKHFGPHKLVFPTLGNHESSPVNSFPPPFITGDQSLKWLLDAYSQNWSVWLQQLPGWSTVQQTIKYGGFYNVKVFEGLRVISLQTNYCNTGSYWLLINSTDPAGQLKWLVEQLQAAEDNGEKVHIIGHIPPGSSCYKSFWENFHKIVNRFESTIIGQFYGHTHKDSFKVFFDDDNTTRATNVACISPSVTSYQQLNMGFRIYTMDGNYPESTYQLLDHESYYLNITDANLTNKPKWQLEYTVKDTYGMKSLQPADWAELIHRFWEDDPLFQKYVRYYYKMHSFSPCEGSCKSGKISDLCYMGSGGSPLCDNPQSKGAITGEEKLQE